VHLLLLAAAFILFSFVRDFVGPFTALLWVRALHCLFASWSKKWTKQAMHPTRNNQHNAFNPSLAAATAISPLFVQEYLLAHRYPV